MSSKYLVLLVDKSYNSSLILNKRIESMGFATDSVNSAEAALNYLKSSEKVPDLILVNMNAADETLENLPENVQKNTNWDKLIPFAALSATHEKTLLTRLLTKGYVDFLVRPIEYEVFKDRVEKLLKKSVTLSDQTYRRPMDENASLQINLKLTQINEFGLIAQSEYPLALDSMMVLNSITLGKVLEEPACVRIVSCKMNNPKSYSIVLSFVGLESSQIRSLRQFALSKPDTSAA